MCLKQTDNVNNTIITSMFRGKLFSGFVQVLEILESSGILLWHFPELENDYKFLESPGDL